MDVLQETCHVELQLVGSESVFSHPCHLLYTILLNKKVLEGMTMKWDKDIPQRLLSRSKGENLSRQC